MSARVMIHNPKRKDVGRPRYVRRILHCCSLCRREGLRPGILETATVAQSVKDWASQKFSELLLDESGVCEHCRSSADIRQILAHDDT